MAKRSFKVFVEQELGKVPHFFIYAVLEWVMILILFLDGFLAFLANEFANFFELPVPCLLCTRIDHVLVQRNVDFYYNDSICQHHKKNVSSLAFCHAHKKISDIRSMCESCLLSFATEKESDCDTYKSLLGILHKDIELFVDEDQELHLSLPAGKNEPVVEKSNHQRCSCCGEPLKVKVKSSYTKLGINTAPAPTPRTHSNPNLDLSHIKYSELKLNNNNEDHNEDTNDCSSSSSRGISLEKPFREDAKAAGIPLLMDADDEDKTPNFIRGNKFFGIPLSDSATNSPRWTRIARKSGLDKTEFASESAHEVEGDILHHLKRQVRMDRKSLMALYMELDEERSASAVAANNAMAMITRLQAEKAAVQMEALQYQRMMEEQAEYDQEALQEMSSEIEAYRQKYGCLKESDFQTQGDESDDGYQVLKPPSSSSYNGRPDCSSPTPTPSEPMSEKHDFDSMPIQQQDDQVRGESIGFGINGIGIGINGIAIGIGKPKPKKLFQGSRHLDRMRNLDKKMQISSEPGAGGVSVKYTSTSDFSDDEDIESMEEDTVSTALARSDETKADLLKTELSHIHKKIEALAADGLLKHVTHLKDEVGSEGSKLLTEISHNLHRLQQFVTTIPGLEGEAA